VRALGIGKTMIALTIASICLLVVIVLSGIALAEARALRVTRLSIAMPHWPGQADSVRIAHISDLHLPRLPVPLHRLLDAVDEIDPDIVVISGDTVARDEDVHAAVSLIQRLAAHGPVLCVTGNIERMHGLDVNAFGEAIEAVGGLLLRDAHWRGTANGAKLCVLGLERRAVGMPDLESMLAEAPDADVTIVVGHLPSLWLHMPRERTHLFLCGHTHGGQLRMPVLGRLLAHSRTEWKLKSGILELPEQGGDWAALRRVFTHEELCDDDAVRHCHLREGRPLMCVSRGVGSVLFPMRLGSPPEVIGITIEGEAAGDASGGTEVG
ncbi:MAG: metallophosphoesterase, partial [Armatimonadota bacterium]